MKLPDGRVAKVTHLRMYVWDVGPQPIGKEPLGTWSYKDKRPYSIYRKGLVPLTKGGKTIVQVLDLYDQEHIVAVGYAWCRPDENYNRKLGVRIALGRALTQIRSAR